MAPKITHIATLLTPWLGALVPSSLALAQNKADKAPQQKYNVVMIMTDDHTAQMMSCYDKRYVNTPNLDRIADNGVKFTNSFDVSHPHDAVYYIMHVWKLLGFDATNDELFIMGNIPEYEWHIENLNRYINKVYTINPTAEFNRAPATQVKGMPFDLITLFTKG